jgi:hypothetical protein
VVGGEAARASPAAAIRRVGSSTERGTSPRNSSGETYSPSRLTPKCRQGVEQCPGPSVPRASPRCTTSPASSVVVTGS